jgi:hypothetical protein
VSGQALEVRRTENRRLVEPIDRQAARLAREAQDRVDALEREADELDKALSDAQAAVDAANTVADIRGAQAKLDELGAQKRQLELRINVQEPAVMSERRKAVHITKECLDNPLDKACM